MEQASTKRVPWNKGLRGTPGGRYPKGHNRQKRHCEVCNLEFEYYGCEAKGGKFNRRFCSVACRYAGLRSSMKGVNQGASNGNWKNGATSAARLFRESPAYKRWRLAVYSRDNYTCQLCGARGGKLAADHIKPFALYPKLRLDLNNGRTLCLDCHRRTPTFGRNVSRKTA